MHTAARPPGHEEGIVWWGSHSGRRCQRELPGGTPRCESRGRVTLVQPAILFPDTSSYPPCRLFSIPVLVLINHLFDSLSETRLQEKFGIHSQAGQGRSGHPHIPRQQRETHRMYQPSPSAGSAVRAKTFQKSTIWTLFFPSVITIATSYVSSVPN